MSAGRQDVHRAGLTVASRGHRATGIVVSCEHGGNQVPPEFRELFADAEDLLDSHRGFDAGALVVAQELARALDAPLVAATTTRLVIDLNRSPGHRNIHSERVAALPREVRDNIVERYYLPYRQRLEALVAGLIADGHVATHVSSHSFTPVLHDEVRRADVGILYDPGRPGEVALADRWIAALRARAPQLTLRRNYPYTGKSDGLCTWLRRRHPPADYVGIELEVNQRHVAAGGPRWRALRAALVASLVAALAAEPRISPRSEPADGPWS